MNVLVRYAAIGVLVAAVSGMLVAGWRYIYVEPREQLAEANEALDAANRALAKADAAMAAAETACGQFRQQAAQCSAQLDEIAGRCSTQSSAAEEAARRELDAIMRRHEEILRAPDRGPNRMNRAFREIAT